MRILLLSYCFPPVPLTEAHVTAKVMGHVDASIDVVSAAPDLWSLPPDHSLDEFAGERFGTVHRVGGPGMRLLLRSYGRVPLFAERPDPLVFLNRRVESVVGRLGLANYDLIVSRSQLHSIHLAALALARRPDCPPWVAHFSDPWHGNPARRHWGSSRWIDRRQESSVLQAADRLVFTSDKAADFALNGHPPSWRAKASAIPHCFVPSLYPEVPTERGPSMLLRHVGHLRRDRSPEPVFQALGELQSRDPTALAGVRLDLLGQLSPDMIETEAAWSLPPGMLTASGSVDYLTSLHGMREADVLVVTETGSRSSLDLHAKIVDYAGAAKPIVGMVPPGPTASLIGQLGGWVADPWDPGSGANSFRDAINEARRRRDAPAGPWGTAEVRARYDAARVAARLDRMYREVA